MILMWDKVDHDSIYNCIIINMVLLDDGFYDVSKKWM